MSEPRIHIQKGNSKLGRTMNIALPPGITCAPGVPCYNDGCYGRKFYELREICRNAWDDNYALLLQDRVRYFALINSHVLLQEPDLFRWHVSGDFPDLDYLVRMIDIAEQNPKTKFLCFTKQYELIGKHGLLRKRQKLPDNFSLVVSAWPGLELPEELVRKYPVAWMRDVRKGRVPDPRIPSNTKTCGGGCDKCGLCWNIKAGESTTFNRH